MSDNLPHMDYRQHRRARRLVHECCNYDEGNCLLLDAPAKDETVSPQVTFLGKDFFIVAFHT